VSAVGGTHRPTDLSTSEAVCVVPREVTGHQQRYPSQIVPTPTRPQNAPGYWRRGSNRAGPSVRNCTSEEQAPAVHDGRGPVPFSRLCPKRIPQWPVLLRKTSYELCPCSSALGPLAVGAITAMYSFQAAIRTPRIHLGVGHHRDSVFDPGAQGKGA
jgi:hypothetical protein